MPYNPYPYNMYPQNNYASYSPQPVQYAQTAPNSYATQQQQPVGIVWVDGEVGAKAHQLPAGWPANTPMPLWDTNDTVIYLKSVNQMGMPNPLQKIHYRMEEHEPRTSGTSCASAAPALMAGERDGRSGHDENYITREDFERMKQELRESITEAMNSQNQTTKKGGGKANESAV